MTEQTLRQIVQRAVRDGAFRAQLKRDPAGALAEFKLTAEERSALISGDPARLTALGVDQRVSKALSVGGVGPMIMSVQPELVAREASVVDEGGGADIRGIIGDPASAQATVLVEPGQSASDLHMRLVEQDLNIANGAILAASVPADSGARAAANLRRIEQDLDIAEAKVAEGEGANDFNLRRIEQDLDVTQGTNLDLPQPDADSTLTEY
jgi:hypothetical protein